MRIFLLKATHFPFVAAIWTYEKAPWRVWRGQKGVSEEDYNHAGSWHLNLDPQLHPRTNSVPAPLPSQRKQTPRKSVLNRVRQDNDRFSQSPAAGTTTLAALMSRSEISLVKRPVTRRGGESQAVHAPNRNEELLDVSITADLGELKRMVTGLCDLVEELKGKLDHQSGPAGSEGDDG